MGFHLVCYCPFKCVLVVLFLSMPLLGHPLSEENTQPAAKLAAEIGFNDISNNGKCAVHVNNTGKNDKSQEIENCSLPGIDPKKLNAALNNAIMQNGKDYGFPLEILAAAFGLDDKGWKFDWHPLHFSRSRMEFPLEHLRERLVAPADAPKFIGVDLPGVGSKLYDAELLRAFFATPLFPYRLHIIRVKEKTTGYALPLVKLDRGTAKYLKLCLSELEKREPSSICPAINVSLHNAAQSGKRTDERNTPHLAKITFGFVSSDGSDKNSRTQEPTAPNKIDSLLAKLATTGYDQPIELEGTCSSVKSLNAEQIKVWELSGVNQGYVCHFVVHLHETASAYYNIRLRGSIAYLKSENSKDSIAYINNTPNMDKGQCGPPDFHVNADVKTVEPHGCQSDFAWEMYGRVLLEDRNQHFQVLLPNFSQDPEIRISLEGLPKPPLIFFFTHRVSAYWCYPNGCSRDPFQ